VKESKTIVIHSRRLSIYLQLKGFVLIGVRDNFKTKYNIFLFAESENLRKAMSAYKDDDEFHAYLSNQAVGR
jgi:hypothetical protein